MLTDIDVLLPLLVFANHDSVNIVFNCIAKNIMTNFVKIVSEESISFSGNTV